MLKEEEVTENDISELISPFARFMFMGPTGVGKTELATALAHSMFGSEEALVTFYVSR